MASSLANSRFDYLLREHSEPGIRYARLRGTTRDDERYALWRELHGGGNSVEQRDLVIQRNGLLTTLLGDFLSQEHLLEIYGQYTSTNFLLATDSFDNFLPRWYTRMYVRALRQRLNRHQWLDLIWNPLKSLVRAVIRVIGKTGQHHGNIRQGLVFIHGDDGQFHAAKLYDGGFSTAGSVMAELEHLCNIIVVIFARLRPWYLISDENLSTVPRHIQLANPQVNDYVRRIRHYINAPDGLILEIVLEDPLWWTTQERMDFLEKSVHHMFYVLNEAYCQFILDHFTLIPEVDLDTFTFSDQAMNETYNYSPGFYRHRGCIVKVVRNIVIHYNQHLRRIFRGQNVPGYVKYYLMEQAIAELEVELGLNMVRYAFDGILRYLEDIADTYEDRVIFAFNIEFREGFQGYSPEYTPLPLVSMDLI